MSIAMVSLRAVRTFLVVADLGFAVASAVVGLSGPVSQWMKRARWLALFGVPLVAVYGVYGVLYDREVLPSLAFAAGLLVGPTRGYLAERREDRSPA
jgi:hypothetical protein